MERLYAATLALAACKQRLQNQPPAFRAQALAAIQAMDSMKVTVANNAQALINMLLEAPCLAEQPSTPEQTGDPLPAPTPISETEEEASP